MNDKTLILDLSAPSSTSRSSCAMAMMIKAPHAGKSKTRLVPPLTHAEAAELSVCFLRDTSDNIANMVFNNNAEGVAVYTPIGAERDFDGLLPAGFSLLAQRGEGFGERLFHAAEDLLRIGFESLCLIDSDSPTLPPELLMQATRALESAGDRVVLGPTDDGGYYLIGIKRIHQRLFTNITWSTAHVLEQTIERANEINLDVELLPVWYDVDDASSLNALCNELFSLSGNHDNHKRAYSAPHTRRFLAQLIEAAGRKRIWPDVHHDTGATA